MPRTSIASALQGVGSTRDAILDAAESRFAASGYAAASMRDIAGEAGLRNQASIYHHFRDKRALYESVLQRGLDSIVAFVEAGERDLLADEREDRRAAAVDATVDLVFGYLAAHPDFARLVQRAALDDGLYMHAAVSQMFRPLYAHGLRALSGAEGMWMQSELPHLAAGLYQLIFGYFGSAPLLEGVLGEDPLGPHALERQRRFLKRAMGQLLGLGSRRITARIVKDDREAT